MPQIRMNIHRQRMWLVTIMTTVAMTVGCVALALLYQTAYEEEKARLVESAQSQARLMEAVAKFDSVYSHNFPKGTEAATISQFIDAHKKFKGFGETGEFILAKENGGRIEFLLSHRHTDLSIPDSLPLDSPLAESIRRALNGESGTLVGPDYRKVITLAAYEPITTLKLALVAKIDIAEIRAPFYRTGLWTLGLGAGVIGLGIFIFWRYSNPLVEEIVKSREQLRNLTQRLQEIREEEKARIAREVHDELGQSLTALRLELNTLAEEGDPEQNPYHNGLEELNNHIDQIIRSVQRISTQLRPQILDVFGLAEAIRWQIEEYQKRTSLQFEVQTPQNEVALDKERSTVLFRIFQETLTNILRHAEAKKVRIHLNRENGFMILRIEDDGIGIEKNKLSSPHSLGLLGMRERALTWGGDVNINGAPHQGTTVTVRLPLDAKV